MIGAKNDYCILDLCAKSIATSPFSFVMTEKKLEAPGPRFVYANPKFISVTGYTSEELYKLTPRVLQGEMTNKRKIISLKESLKKDNFYTGFNHQYKKTGEIYFCSWLIEAVYNTNKEHLFYFSLQCQPLTSDNLSTAIKTKADKEDYYEAYEFLLDNDIDVIYLNKQIESAQKLLTTLQPYFNYYFHLSQSEELPIEKFNSIVEPYYNLRSSFCRTLT